MRIILVLSIVLTLVFWAAGIVGFVNQDVTWTLAGYAAGAVTFSVARKILVPDPLAGYAAALHSHPDPVAP